MKTTALVLLVSRETIPNFLAIKTFNEAESYIFITTNEMENEEKGNRRKWLIKAANIEPERAHKVVVDAFNKEEIIHKLKNFTWDQFDCIIVNLTGGTKIMALACYQFFYKKSDELWYTPENNNQSYLKVDNPEKKRNIHFKITVNEYLACCGIYKQEKKYTEKSAYMPNEFTTSFFKDFVNSKIPLESVEFLRKTFRGDEASRENKKMIEKGILLDGSAFTDEIKNHIEEIGFGSSIKNGVFTRNDLDYLTGGWFEEHVFFLLQSKIPDTEKIRMGIFLNPNASKSERAKYFTNNDLDVVFTHNNALYVVECKSGGMDDNELFNKTVYLASALRKYFGLTVKTVLCTLSSMTEKQKEKAETLNIQSFDFETFIHPNAVDIISEKLKI